MWQLFIVTFIDWWEIQFDQVWSSLIHFGQIWSKKVKNIVLIWERFVEVTSQVAEFNIWNFQFFINIFLLLRNQIWSILDRSDPKKSKTKQPFFILSVNVTTFYSNNFGFVKIQFDPVWSSLGRSDPKTSKSCMVSSCTFGTKNHATRGLTVMECKDLSSDHFHQATLI